MFKGNFHVRVGSTSIVNILTDWSSKHCLICRTSFRIRSFCEKVASASASSRHLGNYRPLQALNVWYAPDGPVRPATSCQYSRLRFKRKIIQAINGRHQKTSKVWRRLKTSGHTAPYGWVLAGPHPMTVCPLKFVGLCPLPGGPLTKASWESHASWPRRVLTVDHYMSKVQ